VLSGRIGPRLPIIDELSGPGGGRGVCYQSSESESPLILDAGPVSALREKLDPDPHESQNSGVLQATNEAVEGRE
jgi:hypothetical protein